MARRSPPDDSSPSPAPASSDLGWGPTGLFQRVVGHRFVDRIREEGPRMGLLRARSRFETPMRRAAQRRWQERNAGKRVTDGEFFHALRLPSPQSGQELRDRLAELDRSLRDRFAAGLKDPRTASALASELPAVAQATIDEANAILAGDVTRAIPWVPQGAERAWHAAYRPEPAGVWPQAPTWEIEHVGDTDRADVRLTWELNRHQHLQTLGRAYLLTRDGKYAEAVVDQLLDWIAHNPFLIGVNWLHAQEVGLRLKSWMWAYGAVSSHSRLDPDTRLAIYKMLWTHSRYLRLHLSGGPDTHNHLLTEVCSLAMWSNVFPDGRTESDDWAAAIRVTAREVDKQFWEDGSPGERSVGYHLFTLESLVELAAQMVLVSQPLRDPAASRLRAMTEFAAQMLRPDGTFPRIGDTDDGRGFRLADGNAATDRRGALGVASVLLRIEGLAWSLDVPHPASYWLLGSDGEAQRSRVARRRRRPSARLYSRSGLAVLHTSGPVSSATEVPEQIVVSGGPCELRPGVLRSHMHCDGTSVVWWRNGEELLIDPATIAYNGPMDRRVQLRKPSAHSGLTAGDRDHFDVTSMRFGVWGIQRSRLTRWATGDGWQAVGFRLAAAPDGPETDVWLERTVVWKREPSYLVFFDTWHGEGTTAVAQQFQLGSNSARIDPDRPRTVRLRTRARQFPWVIHFADDLPLGELALQPATNGDWRSGWFSGRYGTESAGLSLIRRVEHQSLPARGGVWLGPVQALAEGHWPEWSETSTSSVISVPLLNGVTDRIELGHRAAAPLTVASHTS